jgi:hypothetical protein
MSKRYTVTTYHRFEEGQVTNQFNDQDRAIQKARALCIADSSLGYRVFDTVAQETVVDYPPSKPENWHFEDPGDSYPGQPV